MKLPKTVFIVGREWKVVEKKKNSGASFNTGKATLFIGTSWEKGQTQINFLHEILEAIMTERMHRYKLPYISDDNGNYIYVMKHEEMNQVVADLALALKDVLK